MTKRTIVLWMTMALMGTGCAGRSLVRPQPDTLVLGKTTREEIMQRLGEPASTTGVVKNEHALTAVRYVIRALLALPPNHPTMDFLFLEGVLVGYRYSSALPNDTTDFDDTKVYQLKKGQTTRAQVIELLGPPSGMYIYPLISSRTETGLVYFFRGLKMEGFFKRRIIAIHKLVVVTFDVDDVVTGAELGSGGDK